MRNKKLYAALLVGTMLVGMMGSTVMASSPTGTTNFTYNSGTITPPDTVDPQNPEGDPNNWAITYDRNVMLSDDNVATQATDAQSAGAQINFEVKQKVPGTDGDAVTEANIGANGLSVQTTADTVWTSGTEIAMDGGSGVEMRLANTTNAASPKFLAPTEEIVNLTTTRTADKGYAALTENSNPTDGVTYTKTITWTVTKKA